MAQKKSKVVNLKDLISKDLAKSLDGFDNGTKGKTYTGQLTWQAEVYNPDREKTRKERLEAIAKGDKEKVEQLSKKMEEFESLVEFEFTLDKKIPILYGSLTREVDGVVKKIFAENVEKIYIRETMADKILLEELPDGSYKLTLTKSILEIRQETLYSPKAVYVTDITAKDFAALKMLERNLDRLKKTNSNFR